jgi:hypothetical protein
MFSFNPREQVVIGRYTTLSLKIEWFTVRKRCELKPAINPLAKFARVV